MSEHVICTGCNRAIDTDGPLTATEVAQAFSRNTNWDYINGSNVVVRGQRFQVKVVQKYSEDMPRDEYDRQGSTYEQYIIFEIGGQFFRKDGIADSYGDVTWGGGIRKVEAKTKTIQVFE